MGKLYFLLAGVLFKYDYICSFKEHALRKHTKVLIIPIVKDFSLPIVTFLLETFVPSLNWGFLFPCSEYKLSELKKRDSPRCDPNIDLLMCYRDFHF